MTCGLRPDSSVAAGSSIAYQCADALDSSRTHWHVVAAPATRVVLPSIVLLLTRRAATCTAVLLLYQTCTAVLLHQHRLRDARGGDVVVRPGAVSEVPAVRLQPRDVHVVEGAVASFSITATVRSV